MTTNSTIRSRQLAGKRTAVPKSPLAKRLYHDRYLLLLFLPCFLYYVLFRYAPMWGVLISFKDFKPFVGFWGSDWVGLKYFERFFHSPDAWRIIRNTLRLGLVSLVFSFPIPIVFSLALNEMRHMRFKKLVQTVSYMPHFLSAVVVCGMIVTFTSPVHGIINQMIVACGGKAINFLSESRWFVPVYVISDIWQETGWLAILYLAAITNIDPQMYEAATLDGASRLRQIISITIPSIAPTIVITLILQIGSIFDVSLEKVLLLYSPVIYDTADVIATYVYRQGLQSSNFSYATAVGLFSGVTNLILLLIANTFSKKISDVSIF